LSERLPLTINVRSWIEQTEGAKFWLKVMNDLKVRGVSDILIATKRTFIVSGRRSLMWTA